MYRDKNWILWSSITSKMKKIIMMIMMIMINLKDGEKNLLLVIIRPK